MQQYALLDVMTVLLECVDVNALKINFVPVTSDQLIYRYWQIPFNISKCQNLLMGTNHIYIMGGCNIEQTVKKETWEY